MYARSWMDKKIQLAYDKRSAFAHYGIGLHKGSKEITSDDYDFISKVLLLITTKILRLRKQLEITRIEDVSFKNGSSLDNSMQDKNSLDVYLQKIKYGGISLRE